MNTYDFSDNSHIKIQKKQIAVNEETDAKNFATRLNETDYLPIDEDLMHEKKNRLKMQSPF